MPRHGSIPLSRCIWASHPVQLRNRKRVHMGATSTWRSAGKPASCSGVTDHQRGLLPWPKYLPMAIFRQVQVADLQTSGDLSQHERRASGGFISAGLGPGPGGRTLTVYKGRSDYPLGVELRNTGRTTLRESEGRPLLYVSMDHGSIASAPKQRLRASPTHGPFLTHLGPRAHFHLYLLLQLRVVARVGLDQRLGSAVGRYSVTTSMRMPGLAVSD